MPSPRAFRGTARTTPPHQAHFCADGRRTAPVRGLSVLIALCITLMPGTPAGAVGPPFRSEFGPERPPVSERAPVPRLASSRLLQAAGIVALSTFGDRTMAHELPEGRGPGWDQAARVSEKLGRPLYLGLGLGLVWGAGRLSGHPGVAASALRIGAGTAAAGLAANVLKYPLGRARPFHTPDDADEYRPFSGWSSFPSGHTSVAFALAAGIDEETRAGWVPWVVYPVAGAVGWSRMRDNRHWLSDVAAGAVLGSLLSRYVIRRLMPGADVPEARHPTE